MYDGGADIVYHAAGGSGGGVFEAASEAGGLAIGVDSDQYNTADPSVQDVIMTSMLKNVNVAVYNYLTEVAGGTFPAGVNIYDLSVDGVGYSTSGGRSTTSSPTWTPSSSRSSTGRSRFRPLPDQLT